ncbi:MAG: amidohydrolase family protein, partial [Deltaproteobacteria bacterium]|nr:amidohydrolase family protein [Deltaproteobacteria bacterium]
MKTVALEKTNMPSSSRRPEMVLVNAQVLSCDPEHPVASEVAVGGGKILRLGQGLLEDEALAKGAAVVDCGGGTLVPGFVDAHLHFFSFVDSLLCLNLRPSNGIRSIKAIQAALRQEAANTLPGEWIKGKGYNEFYLEEKHHPTRWELDAAAPHHPVKLTHRSHHAHVLNTLALDLLEINCSSPDPPEGIIDRDPATGEPTGLLFEMGELLARAVPHWDEKTFTRGVKRATDQLAAAGVTAFLDASPIADISKRQAFQDYKSRGLIPQKIVTMVGRDGL